jgi:hypothetical protein
VGLELQGKKNVIGFFPDRSLVTKLPGEYLRYLGNFDSSRCHEETKNSQRRHSLPHAYRIAVGEAGNAADAFALELSKKQQTEVERSSSK